MSYDREKQQYKLKVCVSCGGTQFEQYWRGGRWITLTFKFDDELCDECFLDEEGVTSDDRSI